MEQVDCTTTPPRMQGSIVTALAQSLPSQLDYRDMTGGTLFAHSIVKAGAI